MRITRRSGSRYEGAVNTPACAFVRLRPTSPSSGSTAENAIPCRPGPPPCDGPMEKDRRPPLGARLTEVLSLAPHAEISGHPCPRENPGARAKETGLFYARSECAHSPKGPTTGGGQREAFVSSAD